MKACQRLAHAFAAEGVTNVFGLMGSATMHWLDELNRIGVRKHEVRHEGFGLGAADGGARATHTPGVAHATRGPGVTQLASALVTASRASSPVVVFSVEDAITDCDGVHHYDQQRFAESDCVIAVGASLNRYTMTGGYLFPNSRFVHLTPARFRASIEICLLRFSGGLYAKCMRE